ncbi:MAG: hypothetical protein JXR84_02900 [Anaerolineae bacterium]|nr:hypothetical protein [Anaerolineae bacterium]
MVKHWKWKIRWIALSVFMVALFIPCVMCVNHLEIAQGARLPARTIVNKMGNANEQTGQIYRGLWVWNTDIVDNAGAQDDFFTFARFKDIDGAYLYAYSLLASNPDGLGDFIQRAAGAGISVELLAGDPSWALSTTHSIALGFVQQAITFTQSMTESSKPVGIHLDIEPYLLPEWNTDQSGTISQYLDVLGQSKQELMGSGTALSLTVDIPFWYDTITATYQNETKPLNQHVQDIVDRVALMDYRDFAEGADGLIVHAENEMEYAQSITKALVIGVETNDLDPEKITFFEEGEAVMESELALVAQYYQTNSAFYGFAIHDYVGYRRLAPISRVYLPLLLRNHVELEPLGGSLKE